MQYPILNESTFPQESTALQPIGTLECISCTITRELGGADTMSFEYPCNGNLANDIEVDKVVTYQEKVGDTTSTKAYRIASVKKRFNTLQVSANAIIYDLGYLFFSISSTAQKRHLRNANQFETFINTQNQTVGNFDIGFRFVTHPGDPQNEGDIVIEKRDTWFNLMGQVQDAFGVIYAPSSVTSGSYITVDRITLPTEPSYTIEYARNMTEFNVTEHDNGYYNAVNAYWSKDGNMLSATAYVDGTFPIKRFIAVDATKNYESAPTGEQLLAYAQGYISQNDIGHIQMNVSTAFIKDLVTDGDLELGDLITVKNSKYNFNKNVRIIKKTYNVLLERAENYELSDALPSIVDQVAELYKGGGK